MSTEELIRQRLAALQPQALEIFDESHEHAGHAGARESGGGHFQVFVVSEAFNGKNKVARHRMIYETVNDLMPSTIHALAIRAYTPEELDAVTAEPSPENPRQGQA